ncbi:MAG TPA: hypothetical protein VF540_02135, partial [Segetibacter sp.]
NSGPLLNIPGTDYTDVVGFPQGFGKTFRGKAGRVNWFHVALPTLDLYDHGLVFLDEIQVNFQTSGTAVVSTINLHSAHRSPFFRLERITLAGDYRTRVVLNENLLFFTPPVNLTDGSLCISILVKFGSQDSNITFTRAYARFSTER